MALSRIVALLLLALGASDAFSQPVRAVAEDGRAVLLFEDGVWIDSTSVWAGLRVGEPVESASGRFTVHLPDGWSASAPTGEMLQGEILFRNEADSTYLSPQFVPDSSGATPLLFVDEFVNVWTEEPNAGMSATPATYASIDGQRAVWRRVIEPSGLVLQVAAIEASGGFVMSVGTVMPGVSDQNLITLLRSIEITQPETP